MPNQNIAETIKRFIVTNFYVADPASLSPQVSFYEAGIIDSTGVLEVVKFLEETFGITIADSEILPENLDSLNGLLSFVERKLSAPLHIVPPAEAPVASRTLTTSASDPVLPALSALAQYPK